MAEREGFEPSVQLPVRHLSKVVPSATRPSLQVWLPIIPGDQSPATAKFVKKIEC